MSKFFYENPILNSPYQVPTRYHPLDEDGQPLEQPPVHGRRRSERLTPVPKPRKKKADAKQGDLDLFKGGGTSNGGQKYHPNALINEIRSHVASWRELPSPADWGVTPTTASLLRHWRSYEFQGVRPFFCQIEAVETIIWLTEYARREKRYKKYWDQIVDANNEANPDLIRLAMKMATGTGKTTVMAMLIAWQAANAARSPSSSLFTRGFLIITPGITIRDRLQVIRPEDAHSYYRTRELVPLDLLPEIDKAKIIITNYHAFKRREKLDVSKVGRALLQGRGDPIETIETEGEMLQRACGDLLAMKNVLVINDEAHHCYRQRPQTDDEVELKGDEKDEAKKNNEAARLWISGIEALNRKVGVRAVYDLSATPFFLSGSGYEEGTLFPWAVSDFSLMDAIECGIVKLPRVPVADNDPNSEDVPIYRDLWKHIGKELPKKGAAKSGSLDPFGIPTKLQTALTSLYGHYEKTYEQWVRAGIPVPPVFIVVCNNTATSKLVYEWISGFERLTEDGERDQFHPGHLSLFQNYDVHGYRLAKPNTILIDSQQLESGDVLDPMFREIAGPEIEQFKREVAVRSGAAAAEKVSDSDLLREVMNTVGKAGRLGEQVRCVVSVAMLTEGWDTNTVTHILGVRAFGTQLLCEQVVGRALRRQSYDLNEEGLFEVEYADILGIPFDFAAKPVRIEKPKPPKRSTRVHAVKGREALEIVFPRIAGYRKEFPEEKVTATFTEDSLLLLTPALTGPCKTLLEGIVGEGVEIGPDVLNMVRPSEISFHLAKHLLYTRFREIGEPPPMHLFGPIKAVVRRWIDEGYLQCTGDTVPAMVTYQQIADIAAELIFMACQRGADGESRIKAVPELYNPLGSTAHVSFSTTKEDLWETSPAKCHINYVVCDSSWESELARVVESHPRVKAYVKNQGSQFEVPYRDGSIPKRYYPDFIVQIDDGHPDPLNLVVETKGFRGLDAQLKAETMATLWVPGVNNLGTYGRWDFAEFRDVYEIERAFAKIVDEALKKNSKEAVA